MKAIFLYESSIDPRTGLEEGVETSTTRWTNGETGRLRSIPPSTPETEGNSFLFSDLVLLHSLSTRPVGTVKESESSTGVWCLS